MTVTRLRRLARDLHHARAERDEAVAALRKAGVCPCSLVVLDDPGPTHLPSCPWANPNYSDDLDAGAR